jgi:hypothetical protein
VASNGFAFLPGFAVGTPSIDAAQSLGDVDIVEGLEPIQELIPRALDEAPPNTYSGNFGRADFPLHTDLAHWARPPRYIVLRCVRGAPNVATRILDGLALIAGVGTERLRMALVQPRRPMRNGRQLLRLLERSGDFSCNIMRWDSIYLCPASRLAAEVFFAITSILASVRPVEFTLLEPGDTLIIDNWRCLHGRSAATGSNLSRHIDRVYLTELR